MKHLFFMILIHLIVATPQINLYLTDWVSKNDDIMQHDCLRVAAVVDQSNINRQIISYCIGESLSNYTIVNNHHISKLTFADLSKQKITSQQLYLWSAPIDLIEDYQFYLNELIISNDSLLNTTIFYNCTLPRFGLMCQYELNYYHPNHSSLYHIIYDFYHMDKNQPTSLTCYNHLECNRGPYPLCLDWSEICDGKIDCQNDAIDEEQCWELETNECEENEYRCINGQCIPKLFRLDNDETPDCLDRSDEHPQTVRMFETCSTVEPSFECEDIICTTIPLTSSCQLKRRNLIVDILFSIKDDAISNECSLALKCFNRIIKIEDNPECLFNIDTITASSIKKACPDMISIPAVPVLFDDIYFVYNITNVLSWDFSKISAPYLCYNNSRYDDFFINSSKFVFNKLTCYRFEAFQPQSVRLPTPWMIHYAIPPYLVLKKYTMVSKYTSEICNKLNMYQCIDSPKCISIYRLIDGINDCPRNDDEDITKINSIHIVERLKQIHFKCETSNKYIAQSLIENGQCDCETNKFSWCQDEYLHANYTEKHISFQTICDGYIHILPILIDGRNETDETECEQWICNNIDRWCDGEWNCPNGEDEVGCNLSPILNCSSNEHVCISFRTKQLVCLPINKVNDGNIDCLGAFDEPNLCYRLNATSHYYDFYCLNKGSTPCIGSHYLCDGSRDCFDGDDERFCSRVTLVRKAGICVRYTWSSLSIVEQFFCRSFGLKNPKEFVYFSLGEIKNITEDQTNNIEKTNLPHVSLIHKSWEHPLYCHRGLDLPLWLDSYHNLTTCLCPPSYYGDRCQYQNQRISLSIQFRASSHSWQIPFAIIILLIDDSDERIIHSYEQFTYLSVRDCKIKFNIYLLYSTRPKNQSKHYAIRVDIYEKISLDYRGSLFMPIKFSFLPVHRLTFIVDIPRNNNTLESCFNDQCKYGRCIKYFNSPQNKTFCQCDEGWTGQSCTIPYTCQCSSDSLCIGIAANKRSICVCPLYRFGPRCLLIDTVCSTNMSSICQNDGECIPNDEYIESDEKFTCICRKGFIGKRCEIIENKIILSFGNDIILPQSIFIHFIRVIHNNQPQRTTMLQTIPFKQDSVIIHWSQLFHLVFVEFSNKNYYLIAIRKTYIQSIIIEKTINSSDRCQHINELFNETIIQLHLIRRIKYYQLPCQKYSPDLVCFYDNIHLCLCQNHQQQQRVANCFEFNHNMTFNCLGQSVCENGAQCFQDAPDCPQRSICVCPPCYYGTQCQFNTNGLGLSLDAILGYHIQPSVKITQQPLIVQISMALSVIFVILGFINGILSMITFKNKSLRDNGCGYYLFGTSITTLVTTIMFGLKFWILILTQMGIIIDRKFLDFQCHSIDFILRCSLCMDQWFNACAAMEQAIAVIKGTIFNKIKSKQVAKLVIFIVVIIVIISGLDDPISRRLIDEENENEKRIWCIVSYSANLQRYNSTINIFNFITPFLLNLISAIILVTKKSRQESYLETDRSYNQVLREQIRQHKYLFIAPVILVIISIPHLAFSFASKCMKSANDSWLFLVGYLIPFIPPMLTFFLFILPSQLYRKEFQKTIIRYRTKIRRYLCRTS